MELSSDWLQYYETRELLKFIKEEIERYQDNWLCGVYVTDSENDKALGAAQALVQLVDDIKDSVVQKEDIENEQV